MQTKTAWERMRILVHRANRVALLNGLPSEWQANDSSIVEFEEGAVDISEIDLIDIHDPRPSLFILSGQVTQTAGFLKELGKRISDRPEETTVAVRYPEIAEHLREYEIHADIVPLDSNVENFIGTLSSFLSGPTNWTFKLFGNRTEWTNSLGDLLGREGFHMTDYTIDASTPRLRALILGGAFDYVVLSSVPEVDAIERVTSLTIETIGDASRILSLSNEVRLHLSKRSIQTELLPIER